MQKSRKKILIVDDDTLILKLYKRILKFHDYGVITAKNGLNALEILDKSHEKISMIIIDHSMPVMNGLEFMNEFRKKRYSNIPVLMVSGDINPEFFDDRFLFKLGIKSFLSKPFNIEDFIDNIEKYNFPFSMGPICTAKAMQVCN